MASSIIMIIVGLLIWKIVPGWIQNGSRKNKNRTKLGLNILGILIVVLGIVSLFKTLISIFF